MRQRPAPTPQRTLHRRAIWSRLCSSHSPHDWLVEIGPNALIGTAPGDWKNTLTYQVAARQERQSDWDAGPRALRRAARGLARS